MRRPTFGLAWIATAALAACMTPRGPDMRDVPASLKPPGSEHPAITAHGAGVQIYECQAGKADPALYAWTLKGPEAQLRYDAGKALGKHYAGPTWEANDGSKVIGEVVAHTDGLDADSIPWLLLRAKSTSGNGIFSTVQFIQRLHTVGGKAPLTGCSQAYAGTETRVTYSADYYFYGARS